MVDTSIIQLANQLRSNLDKLGEFLVEELAMELVAQGHRATGKLVGSIDYAVRELVNGISLEISYLEYGRFMNDGVPASRIPFGKKTGAKTSKYIQGLIDWINQKQLARGISALGLAIGIARKHKQEGMPTKGSYAFSTNGRRVGFQNHVLMKQEAKINSIVQDGLSKTVEAELEVIIGKITK